ncbi:MAG: bifunctional metallophosphatase/5'-nucleotidase [Deltaproteobacteria bacterium]|nr:bifunctional metallophosphatase/5'-nucleotidase [Candidatus Zymogenaceae bacterium]
MKCVFKSIIGMMMIVSMTAFALGAEKSLTIIHTNDIHSQLMGLSPNCDYSPNGLLDDDTVGGFSRVATVINEERERRNNPVLVIDAGDFMMGSLFHMIAREEAVELTLLYDMGYDVLTLGNHEFDLKPNGLARILTSAMKKGKLPPIVASNVVFDETEAADDSLQALFDEGLIVPHMVIEKDGLRIGCFGLLGKDAAEVAPFSWPVTFSDPTEAAVREVAYLRDTEQVDVVICVSHSGLRDDPKKSEDELLAAAVDGIDVIVSGHTHTVLPEPIVVDDCIIVQAGSYSAWVGVLDLLVGEDGVGLSDYEYVSVDDKIVGDEAISNEISSYIGIINADVLKNYGLTYSQGIAETDYDLHILEEECGLGNLVTDAIRWSVDRREYDPADPDTRVDFTIQSFGVIRSDVLKGKTGVIEIADLFRVVPLGIGVDDTMGYPIVSFYLNASEIKKVMEVFTSIYPIKGSDYFLQVSGVKVKYNPKRMIFDRVTEIYIEDDNGEFVPLDYSDDNTELYKVATNYYNASFIKVVKNYTSGILTMIPKDRYGTPIDDLGEYVVDADPDTSGVQELKDWYAPIEYVMSFPDTDDDGLVEIPDRYRETEGRIVPEPSLNPVKLVAGGNYLTWIGIGVALIVLILLVLVILIPVRLMKRKR